MENILEKLTKEDLIVVISFMHDTIQEWKNGYGVTKEDAEILGTIGSACISYSTYNNKWNLPKINLTNGNNPH